MAETWAKARGLTLDDSLQFWDRGVSAFKGKNVTEGELGRLIELGEKRKVPAGSYLLVENLDRISRQTPIASIALLHRLMEAGFRVVTLNDGREFVSGQSGQDAMTGWLLAGMGFQTGNTESAKKSERLKESWVGRREKIGAKPLTTICPAWLKHVEGKFVPVLERVAIVQRIFTEYIAGKGTTAIASGLRRDGIAPWGPARTDNIKNRVWQKSYVTKILSNPAVIGVFQPHEYISAGKAKRRVPLGDAAEGYYPAVVPMKVWVDARARKKNVIQEKLVAHGPRGDSPPNLFSGILRCGRRGSSVRVSRKSSGGKLRAYSEVADGELNGWDYEDLETCILGVVLTTEAADLWPEKKVKSDTDALTTRAADIEGKLIAVTRAVDALMDSLESLPKEASGEVRTRLALRAEEKFALAEEFNRITADLENVRSAHVATEDSITAVRRLFSARKTPAVRDILAGHVRKIVKDVNVFFPIALRAREAAVIAQATASRKLLRLAKMRSGEECLDDYKFRFSDKHRRKALALAEKLKPRSCWVEVHFKSGIVISTKGQPSGLRLKEEPAFTMEEIDSEGIMIGKIDLDAYGNTPRLTKGTIEEFLQAQQSVAGS